MKKRNLQSGRQVQDFENLHTLPVVTHCPQKYVVVDLETGDLWRPVINNGLVVGWGSLKESEVKELCKLIEGKVQ